MGDDLALGTVIGFAVAGYVFLTRFHLTKDYMARLGGGYEVLFLSAAVGFVGLVLTPLAFKVAVPVAEWTGLARATEWFSDLSETQPRVAHPDLYLAGSAVITAWLFALLLNSLPGVQWYRKRSLRRAAINRGDYIEVILDDALRSRSWVELALDGGKSYVGAPVGLVPMTTDDADIEIVPVFSGHRTDPDRVLSLARYYGDVIGSIVDSPDRSLADLRVAIPVREIVAARPFDLDVYRRFNPDEAVPANQDQS